MGIIPHSLRKHTYVSSDDNYILEKAKDYDINPLTRSEDISQNDTPTKVVVEDFVERVKLKGDDIIVNLYFHNTINNINLHCYQSILKDSLKVHLQDHNLVL